jgi:dGTPase
VRELLGVMIEDTIRHTHAAIEGAGVASIDDVRALPGTLVTSGPDLAPELSELKRFLYAHLYRHHRQIRMKRKADHILERIYSAYVGQPEMLPPDVEREGQRLGAERAVLDYLAGMTDRYATDEYRRLFDPAALT